MLPARRDLFSEYAPCPLLATLHRDCNTGFTWRGVVDLQLGIILSISMFLGALLGGRIALLPITVWLRRMFVVAVLGLAARLLWLLR